MMIAAGYAAVFAYVFFLIFELGGWVQRLANQESSRKVIHTMLFMVWVFIDIFFKNTVHQMIIPFAFLVLNALSFKFKIYKTVERAEQNHMGTVFFAAAILTVMSAAYFLPELYLPSGAAAFCLTFGDGFAALIGYNFPTRKLRKSKSVLGFITCILASFAAMAVFRALYWPELSMTSCALIAVTTAVCELTGGGLDNFTITYGVFVVSYLLAEFPAAVPALIWALIVFAVIFFSRAITYAGSLLALIIVFIFRFTGDRGALAYLLLTYFTIFAVGIVRKKLTGAGKKSHSGRGFLQILINGGLGTVCMAFVTITGNEVYLALGVTAIGGCFIDSLSSDVGRMSPKQPWDPIRRTHVPSGISGGMTALGTVSAAMGSLLIALFAALAMDISAPAAVVAGVMSYAQTLLDTLMGSLLQLKYRCSVCGELTEKTEHCGSSTVYASGLRWLDNNMVNLISSVIITGISYALLSICI